MYASAWPVMNTLNFTPGLYEIRISAAVQYGFENTVKTPFIAEKMYLCIMEKAQVNFDTPTMSKAVQAFVRSRAIRLGSFIAYEENGNIIKEDPRTGQKTIVKAAQKE